MNSNTKNKVHKIGLYLGYFMELFFPKICVTCGNRLIRQENFVCIDCWLDLPVTHFNNVNENKVAQLFWGRANITHAAAYFSYKKGSRYRQLIHAIKYRGMKELGFEIGKRFGFELKEITNFKTVDLLVPVPLHPRKQKNRGYNQSEWIARGISNTMDLPVITNNLTRKAYTSTQTNKNRFERWQNVEEIFYVETPGFFTGKHILLIDDVVTTGSTLDVCASSLLKIDGVKVSIATLAFADI
ncbi:MAG: ComF family protein [Bacteroidales bacterium]|nr:ComF family protein [Bacteroidales bacterium]